MVKGYCYESLDSTNEEAKRLIDNSKIKETSFVLAYEQTNGKGTHGRIWVSPKGAGIYLSIIHLEDVVSDTIFFTQSAAVACVEAINEVCDLDVKLKPVNDIYADGKKLGGILIETRLSKEGVKALITGIGINTHKIERKLEEKNVEPVSIEELLSANKFNSFSRAKLVEKMLEKICFWHNFVFNGQHAKVEKAWNYYRSQ